MDAVSLSIGWIAVLNRPLINFFFSKSLNSQQPTVQMMSTVNMALEEIITTNKQKNRSGGAGGSRRTVGGSRRTGGGGGSGNGGFRSGGASARREKYFSDDTQQESGSTTSSPTSTEEARREVEIVKLNISNLPETVLTADLEELFQDFGVYGVTVHYDEAGQHLGTADLFVDFRSAKDIIREYANIAIDGQEINIAVVDESGVIKPRIQDRIRRVANNPIRSRRTQLRNRSQPKEEVVAESEAEEQRQVKLSRSAWPKMVENLVDLNQEYNEEIYCALSAIASTTNAFIHSSLYTNNRSQHDAAHIFSICHKAMENIKGGSHKESIIFCGESGSGKTTNFYHALRFFCSNNCSKIKVEQINALQNICENFGSAKTLKSDCSTRFGYTVDLLYKSGCLDGFTFNQALPLELTRLVEQKKGDNNFGVFYRLCAALDTDKYGLTGANNYFYLNQGKCQVDIQKEKYKFGQLTNSLSTIGFSESQKELIYRVLSAILHIGNVFFTTAKTSNNEEFAVVANESELQWVAFLLDVDLAHIKAIFCHKEEKEDGTQKVTGLKNVDAGLDLRDAFAKFLYNELFKWIFSRISLFFQSHQPSATITLLDIYGFEKYNNNNFEEFSCTNNQRAVDLLIKRPDGIIPLLEDECKFPKASDENFLQRCNLNHLDKSVFAKSRAKDRLEFGIKHFAGTTYYSVESFLVKNRWLEPASVYSALCNSKDASLAALFAGATDNSGKDNTLYKIGRNQLLFIRCMRPSSERSATKFDSSTICKQIKALCVLEHCNILRHCFVRKLPFEDFARKFKCLLSDEATNGQGALQICKDVLHTRAINQLQDVERFTHNFAAKGCCDASSWLSGWKARKIAALKQEKLLQNVPNGAVNKQRMLNGTTSNTTSNQHAKQHKQEESTIAQQCS
uniref:Myosin motor domain-containing protein n=1 Tax=Ditylenchus dipsaci TaxID=166011 RepID=A0A915CYL4_9BILA